ncbi:hypothetical protein K503DRAFT_819224 [Rhizopogon vinicolor AM-OR11-026]|uniref:Uncharacterized protein n=1 Tax=Rhizopogon vinicolor AM-OR11-026 TaxID=1314800 RepID=A0A1B7MDL4_9AGAM|nr:hypothetical protein K503DRAFT_819224 [Rhizopogon vinicolor AM-OR11-026]
MLTTSKSGLAYFTFAGFSLLALLSATFLYPETKGRHHINVHTLRGSITYADTPDDMQMKDESARPKGDISMKDESVKVPRVTAIKREDASLSPSTSTATSSKGAPRRLPGAGYVAKSPQLSPAVEAAPCKAVGSVDARPQKPLPRNTLSTKPAPALLPPHASQEKTLPTEDSDRERERSRSTDKPPKDRVVTGVKRKSAPRDVGDTQDEEKSKVNSFKKRKMLPMYTSSDEGETLTRAAKEVHIGFFREC